MVAMRRRTMGLGFPPVVPTAIQTLAALLAGSTKSGCWDLRDYSTLWQERNGTSQVTAEGQTLGRADDLSGNGNHLAATADGTRPSTTDLCTGDDSDDILVFPFAGGAGSTDMSVVLVANVTDISGILFGDEDASSSARVQYQTGSGNAALSGISGTLKVDDVAKTTRAEVHSAASGGLAVVTLENVNLTGFTGCSFLSGFSGTDAYTVGGVEVPIAVIDNADLGLADAAAAFAAAKSVAAEIAGT